MNAAIGMALAAALVVLTLIPMPRRRDLRVASLGGLRIRRARAK